MDIKQLFARVHQDLEIIKSALTPDGRALEPREVEGIERDALRADRLADDIQTLARASGSSFHQAEGLPKVTVKLDNLDRDGDVLVMTRSLDWARMQQSLLGSRWEMADGLAYTIVDDQPSLVEKIRAEIGKKPTIDDSEYSPTDPPLSESLPRRRRPLHPGDRTRVSGQYEDSSTGNEVTSVAGHPLPPTRKRGAKYRLVDATKHEALPSHGTSGHRTWTLAGEAKDVQKAIALLKGAEGESRGPSGKSLGRISVSVDKLEQDGEVATVTVRAWTHEEGVDGPLALSEQFKELRYEAPRGKSPISSFVYVDDVTESLPRRSRGTCGKTAKERRQAEHIADSYEERGVDKRTAKSRACATVNARRNERMEALPKPVVFIADEELPSGISRRFLTDAALEHIAEGHRKFEIRGGHSQRGWVHKFDIIRDGETYKLLRTSH